MYRMLQRNLTNYFKNFQAQEDDYRFKMAEILKGLIDVNLYQTWKSEEPKKYEEIGNIVYQIKTHIAEFPRFETLDWDLWGMGYEAIEGISYKQEELIERLKLINLCLGAAYLN